MGFLVSIFLGFIGLLFADVSGTLDAEGRPQAAGKALLIAVMLMLASVTVAAVGAPLS